MIYKGRAADLPFLMFNFNFGNKKPDNKQLIIVGTVLSVQRVNVNDIAIERITQGAVKPLVQIRKQ